MYTLLGDDGKEYGPADANTVREWIAQGRLDGESQVRVDPAGAWQTLASLPEFAEALGIPAPPSPPSTQASPPALPRRRQGLAVTSLVFGVISMLCLGPLAGIPALIIGLVALDRSRRRPLEFSGRGMAIGGIVLGAFSFVWVFVMAGLLLPALAQAKGKAQSIMCLNNLKQIGLAAQIYAMDNQDVFPPSFVVLSNELYTTKILVCAADQARVPANTWEELTADNISYEWLGAGLKIGEIQPDQVIVRCPDHGHVVHADGSVTQGSARPRR